MIEQRRKNVVQLSVSCNHDFFVENFMDALHHLLQWTDCTLFISFNIKQIKL
jgi:hypothetical protein